MKVMHVIHGLNTGGAETLVKEYVTKLDKTKFEPIVLCLDHQKESPYERIIEESGVKVIYVSDFLKPIFKGTFLERIFNTIQRFFITKKIIIQENPEIIHTHLMVNKYIKFTKPKKNTLIIHTIHGDIKRYQKINSKYIEDLKWLIKNYKVKIICLHNQMSKEANELLSINDSIVLNNGIDFSKFETAKSKDVVRKELKIKNDAFVIGHVGRFSKVKNHIFLIKVFKEVYQRNKNAFLLMIGDGEEKKEIEKELAENGLINKYLILSNRTDIPDLLNAMDTFVLPSISEGLGISLIEAQKSKLPCIVSDAIPDSAIISNLVKKKSLQSNETEWAEEILSFDKPKKIVINDNDWDINKIVKKLEKIYLEK